MINSNLNPHQDQPLMKAGAPLGEAHTAMIMIHGRGATAESILLLSEEFSRPGVAYLAPQAENNTWYPYSFLAPLHQNNPNLASALQAIGDLVGQVEQVGIDRKKIVLMGFSQGACLATEFAAHNAGRYGGIIGLSGGLIGPDGTPRNYSGSFEQTPVFLGCSDIDPHIPLERVSHTAEVFENMEATVTKRIYEGMGHTVNTDEIEFINSMLDELVENG